MTYQPHLPLETCQGILDFFRQQELDSFLVVLLKDYLKLRHIRRTRLTEPLVISCTHAGTGKPRYVLILITVSRTVSTAM
jgi:hypothetical protein